MSHPIPRSALLLVSSLAAACNAFVGDYEADLEIVSAIVEPDELCAVEEQFFHTIDLDDESRWDDLADYYEAANPTLTSHLAQLSDALHQGDSARGSTYLWGAAGIGKSFLMRNVFDSFAEHEQCALDLADVFSGNGETYGFRLERQPDLATTNREVVFNELPTVEPAGDFDLWAVLEAEGCVTDGLLRPLVVMDSIDEIHDNAARAVLQSVHELLNSEGSLVEPFVHFVVAGRPGGFASWLTDPSRGESKVDVAIFELKAPAYDSAGALAFRVTSYLEFAELLTQLQPSGVDEYVASVTAAVQRYPFLGYSLGNLAVGNVVIEHTAPGLDEDEEELKAGILDDMLYRNAQSHGRPGNGTELEGTYLRLLEDIAARYAEVSRDGTFVIRSEDTLEATADDGTVLGEVRVRNVLNRGGVAVLTSATSTTTRYRFEPFWLHAHLVERRNRRFDPERTYRGCNEPRSP